jgi:cytidine deaminase
MTRENAQAIRTKVGCAVLATYPESDLAVGSAIMRIYGGCNIEDLWKASSIHAERAAITCAIVGGTPKILKLLVAAEREKFTPCGNCMDFIFQFGGPDCLIAFQPSLDGPVKVYTARELMPEYPC